MVFEKGVVFRRRMRAKPEKTSFMANMFRNRSPCFDDHAGVALPIKKCIGDKRGKCRRWHLHLVCFRKDPSNVASSGARFAIASPVATTLRQPNMERSSNHSIATWDYLSACVTVNISQLTQSVTVFQWTVSIYRKGLAEEPPF